MRHLAGGSYGQILGTLAHLVLLLALGSVPMLLLNLPVGLFARATADKHMAEALAGSNVKVMRRRLRGIVMNVCDVVDDFTSRRNLKYLLDTTL